MSLKFELVLPCYNESKSIEAILKRAIEAAQKAGYSPETFQLILVENGSKDNSREIMLKYKSLPEFSSWFRIVPIDINQGYGYGIWQGLKSTTSPFIAWSHADQQCDPNDSFRALNVLLTTQEGTNSKKIFVKGVRHGRSLKEKFVSRVFEILAFFILNFRIYEINAQPKVFARELLKLCTKPPFDFAFDLYILYVARKSGYLFKAIDVDFPPRVHGFSNWAHGLKNRSRNIKNMIKYMWQLAHTEGRI